MVSGGNASSLPLVGGKPEPTIKELSSPGRRASNFPKLDVPEVKINHESLKKEKARLPEVSEHDLVMHYSRLAHRNFAVDLGFYPLGSCTMKYNPRFADSIASDSRFANMHPSMPEEFTQGCLKVMYEIGNYLCEITGMDYASFQPPAGASGELTGLLIIKKYLEINNLQNKTEIIVPDSAHGTNPASARMAGFTVVEVETDDRGMVNIDKLKEIVNDNTAGLMLTNPNTGGLFEEEILTISQIIHNNGGLLYYDGANLNAIVGTSRPGDMGFDIVHSNLHKTFATPHGGGGPGSGPIGVVDKLKDMLPYPMARKNSQNYFWDYEIKNSIGKIHSYNGNFGILVRAFVYIKMLGEEGVKNMTKHAILNANYIKKSLSKVYDVPFSDGTLHEFVISGENQKNKGAKALDIAKSLLDYGFYAPTIYFPTNISESIMIEPTESEDKSTLDRFINAMLEIDINIDNETLNFGVTG